jgi:hypothetical protein
MSAGSWWQCKLLGYLDGCLTGQPAPGIVNIAISVLASQRLPGNAARRLAFQESRRQCNLADQFAACSPKALLVMIEPHSVPACASIVLTRLWAFWQVSELLVLFPAVWPSNQADYSQLFFLFADNSTRQRSLAMLRACNVLRRNVGWLRGTFHCSGYLQHHKIDDRTESFLAFSNVQTMYHTKKEYDNAT